jgi:hypothetical protein
MPSILSSWLRVLVPGIVLIGLLWIVWITWQTPLYIVYVFFIYGATVTFLLGWPQVESLGLQCAEGAVQRLGATGFPSTTSPLHKPISGLAESNSVVKFFTALVRVEETKELREEIRGNLIPKIIAYAFLTMLFLFTVPHEKVDFTNAIQTWDAMLRAVGAAAVFTILVVWDGAMCSLQFRRNKRLQL